MHVADLMICHATGMKTRTANRVVVDEFPEFKALYKEFHDLASYIQSEKDKKRFEEYVKVTKMYVGQMW